MSPKRISSPREDKGKREKSGGRGTKDVRAAHPRDDLSTRILEGNNLPNVKDEKAERKGGLQRRDEKETTPRGPYPRNCKTGAQGGRTFESVTGSLHRGRWKWEMEEKILMTR